MRILVIGCGKFGSNVVDKLSDRGNDVVAVDMDENLVDIVNNTMDAMAIVGSGTDYDVLTEVETGKVDLCISCTNSDESTILGAHLAKEMGAKRTISVVRNIIRGSENAKFIEKSLNLDLILNPDYLAATTICDILKEKKSKKIMMAGGHVIAYYVAKEMIQAGSSVCIIENNEERAAHLSGVLPDKVNIVVGDGSNHEFLAREEFNTQDAFITLTGMDEVNILASLYAQDQGIPTVITKINNDSYTDIVKDLNLENIVSPRGTTIDIIIEYVEELKKKK